MTTNTEREELAQIAYRSMYSNPTSPRIQPLNERPQWESDNHYRAADAILAAGYSKPRTITERFEDNGPDELAPLSVVLSDGKPAIMQHDGTFMDYDGSSWDTWEMSYPLTVIWEPEAEPTK